MSPQQTSEAGQNLSVLMHDLSTHLRGLAKQAQTVEHAVSDQLCPQKSQQPDTITQLQSLDYLRQSLEDLAKLAMILGDSDFQCSLSPKITANILQHLTLNDSKALVCPTFTSIGFTLSGTDLGDFDLF